MKPNLTLIISAAILLLSTACGNTTTALTGFSIGNNSFVSNPKSKVTTRTVNIGNVNELKTSAGLSVTYVVSNENKVIIQAPEDVQDKITVQTSGNDLNIGLTRNIRNINSLAVITVMSPAIDSFDASSGSEISLPNHFSPVSGELELEASSGAEISGSNAVAKVVGVESSSGASVEISVTASTVACSTSSGASISIAGTADAVSLKASSGASLSAGKLKARTGSASASSGGSVSCSIKSNANISKSSGGSVRNN